MTRSLTPEGCKEAPLGFLLFVDKNSVKPQMEFTSQKVKVTKGPRGLSLSPQVSTGALGGAGELG